MSIRNILKPVAKDSLFSRLKAEIEEGPIYKDPDKIFVKNISYIKNDPEILEYFLDLNVNISSLKDEIRNKESIKTILNHDNVKFFPENIIVSALKEGLDKELAEQIKKGKHKLTEPRVSRLIRWVTIFNANETLDMMFAKAPDKIKDHELEHVVFVAAARKWKEALEIIDKYGRLTDDNIDIQKAIDLASKFENDDIIKMLSSKINKKNSDMKKIVRESIAVSGTMTGTQPKPATSPGTAEPTTKPITRPGTRPAPGRPTPIRRDRPSVEPRPKATAEEIANKFIELVKER